MTSPADAMPAEAASAAAAREPSLPSLLLIFWATFAVAVVATQVLTPGVFVRYDPDSLMRMVGVRDLLAGQGWFDLTQHRMDPPDGVLMHWSRLIDAPLAGLAALGGVLGVGEGLALTAWPLLLFLGFMAGVMLTAEAVAGRAAAVWSLVLALLFFDPLLFFLPGDVDHHNAQLALMLLTLAAALRTGRSPLFGAAAGCGAALMLAVGLEMLPYVAVLGGTVALRWALGSEERGVAWFGAAFAAGCAIFYLASASPAARFACDSLSLGYFAPAAIAGCGLAALALFARTLDGALLRVAALGGLACMAAAALALVAPNCLAGPYGFLSPELKALWLDTVMEAQPLLLYALREPAGAVAALGPPILAFAVTIPRVLAEGRANSPRALPLALLAAALVLGFYQVRTLPYANAIAIPLLGAWLADVAARRHALFRRPATRALILAGAFVLTMPILHLAFGWAAVEAVKLAGGGRIGEAAAGETASGSLSSAERDCLDASSAALLRSVDTGLVLTPVFYGPAVLRLSGHSVVAGPYHRAGPAILDAIGAMRLPPDEARRIIRARGPDYVAICATAREAAQTMRKAPDGFLAALIAGDAPDWLQPVAAAAPTQLRLWRVTD